MFALTVNALLDLHQATSKLLFIVFGLVGRHKSVWLFFFISGEPAHLTVIGMTFGHFWVQIALFMFSGYSLVHIFSSRPIFFCNVTLIYFWAWPCWLLACRLCYSCHAVIQSFTVLPPVIWMNEWMNEPDSLIWSQLCQSLCSYFWGYLYLHLSFDGSRTSVNQESALFLHFLIKMWQTNSL